MQRAFLSFYHGLACNEHRAARILHLRHDSTDLFFSNIKKSLSAMPFAHQHQHQHHLDHHLHHTNYIPFAIPFTPIRVRQHAGHGILGLGGRVGLGTGRYKINEGG